LGYRYQHEKEAQFVDDEIVAFNKSHAPFTQDNDFVSLNFHVKSESDFVTAGINSLMYCGGMLYIDVLFVMLYIDVLFVDNSCRDQHLGNLLLSKIETEAKSMGVSLSDLDTLITQYLKMKSAYLY